MVSPLSLFPTVFSGLMTDHDHATARGSPSKLADPRICATASPIGFFIRLKKLPNPRRSLRNAAVRLSITKPSHAGLRTKPGG